MFNSMTRNGAYMKNVIIEKSENVFFFTHTLRRTPHSLHTIDHHQPTSTDNHSGGERIAFYIFAYRYDKIYFANGFLMRRHSNGKYIIEISTM